MIHIVKIAQVLTTLGGELRDGRNPTTTGAHKVKDASAKGNYLLQVANVIENATPNTPHSLPSIVIGHDIMNPMLYPESLEVVAKALQQRFPRQGEHVSAHSFLTSFGRRLARHCNMKMQ
jgi:hypothetical protein